MLVKCLIQGDYRHASVFQHFGFLAGKSHQGTNCVWRGNSTKCGGGMPAKLRLKKSGN